MRRETDHLHSLLVAGVLAIVMLMPGMSVGKEFESTDEPKSEAHPEGVRFHTRAPTHYL